MPPAGELTVSRIHNMRGLVEELTEKLIDRDTGFFRWWNREDRLDVYQSGLGWPVLTTIIDGLGLPAPWTQDFGRRKSETLFRALKDAAASWSAVYIKHQDEAYAEIAWAEVLTDERLHPRLLEEFTANPADQGGSSFLGIFAETVDDMVLFTYAPAEFLRISLLGRMKSAIPAALESGTNRLSGPGT
jgi:hypothetical protein